MKKIYFVLGLFILACIGIGLCAKNIVYSNQIEKETSIFIKSNDDLEAVFNTLEPIVNNIDHVKTVAKLKKYKNVKPGKYVLKKSFNTNQLINLLRSGNQTPVKVSFNNQHYVENLAGRLSQQIEADSLSILNCLLDEDFLEQTNLNPKTVLNICMPYTYDCYWNISPNHLRTKFLNAYNRFWNEKKMKRAEKLGLSQNEVISLAAIVQKESQHKPERKRIAGVYLNRVKRGIPLQADPTVIFAAKEKYGRGYIIKRVLNKDLKIDSPYNTYKHKGIPPSAIAMPDVDALNAVLYAENHNYIYFCANPQKIGTHKFAKTLRQHNINAKNYQRWLNKQNVHR